MVTMVAMVHLLQLRTDGKHQFYALFLGHLRVDAYLTDSVDNAYAAVDDVHIDIIAVPVQGNGNSIDWSLANLVRQPFHVLRQVVNFIVKAIDLCGIGDDTPESAKVSVELLLVVLRLLHLLPEPDMSLCLHGHCLQLCFVL